MWQTDPNPELGNKLNNKKQPLLGKEIKWKLYHNASLIILLTDTWTKKSRTWILTLRPSWSNEEQLTQRRQIKYKLWHERLTEINRKQHNKDTPNTAMTAWQQYMRSRCRKYNKCKDYNLVEKINRWFLKALTCKCPSVPHQAAARKVLTN